MQHKYECTHLHSYSFPLMEMIVLEYNWSLQSITGDFSPSLQCNEPHCTFLKSNIIKKHIFLSLFKESLLWFTIDVMDTAITPTVSINRSFRIKLFVALPVGRRAPIAPDFLALQGLRWTYAVEAITFLKKIIRT